MIFAQIALNALPIYIKMKKIISTVLCLIAVCSFTGCVSNWQYHVPKDCIVVSIPEGFELWSNQADVFQKEDREIRGIQRKWDYNYYIITKNAPFSIINFDFYTHDEDSYGHGKVVTAFDINGHKLPFNPSNAGYDITLFCDENTEITPVYAEYSTVGMIELIADDSQSLWDKIYNAGNLFNEDGTPKEAENFYYMIQYDVDDSTLPSYIKPYPEWKTNMEYKEVSVTYDFATYTVERKILEEGQERARCILGRYDDAKYFVLFPFFGDDFSTQNGSLVFITIEIGEGYELTVKFEKPTETEPQG